MSTKNEKKADKKAKKEEKELTAFYEGVEEERQRIQKHKAGKENIPSLVTEDVVGRVKIANASGMVSRGRGWKVNKPKEPEVICSLAIPKPVFLSPVAKRKIELLCMQYTNLEWVGYLVGTIAEHTIVKDITVPPHTVTRGAMAEVEPFKQPKMCIGVIHSHNVMGAFHSGTDDDYVDHNYPVSITAAMKQLGVITYDALVNTETPCGKKIVQKVPVRDTRITPLFNEKNFLLEAMVEINKGLPSVYVPPVKRVHVQEGVHTDVSVISKLEKVITDGKKDKKRVYHTDKDGRVITEQEHKEA